MEEISASELTEYMAYDRIDPFTRVRDDLNTGIICSTLMSVHGHKSKPSDFMTDFDQPEKEAVSEEALFNKLKMFTIAKGGEVK